MNQKMRRRLPVFFVAALILSVTACQKEKPPAELPLPTDRVAPSPVGTSQTVLHKTFSVKTSAIFPFDIPPHAVRPHLHGIFESFVREVHGASDDSANVDFLIVNADQYADLASNRPSEALFSVEASHNQAVNLDLPASLDQPVKYYLVFRNAAGKGPGKVVEADFHVDF
jgi:predicted small lipoprotein YifL